MAGKLKVTGFTRFLIAMLFIVPIAYLVASYANGEDGIGNIRDAISGSDKTETVRKQSTSAADTCEELHQQIKAQERRIEELKRENERLKAQ